jgi:6-phosphogluconate dehydrogenase
MKIGIIGLGRMGAGIAERIVNAGHTVFGFDLDAHNTAQAHKLGVHIENKVIDIATKVDVIWLMVPPGKPVDDVLNLLMPALKKDCIIIDGGNSNFKDSIRRAQLVAQKNVSYLDCGTSGGLHGREHGYCLMVGGDKESYDAVSPLLSLIAAPNGMAHVGPSGAGHYVKMVHNGIEYALLQGYAEGFQLLKEGTFKDVPLNLEQISDLWNHGSIIRSFLLELTHNVYKQDQEFKNVSGEIAEGGTGKWTVQEAQEHGIPVPLIEESLAVRARSRATGGNYATKLVALLRNQFGGHAVKKIG